MKDFLRFSNDQIHDMDCDAVCKLTRDDIQNISPKQCVLWRPEQLDWMTKQQLTFFTPAQRKCPVINIATKKTIEVQKLNLNALSDVELKSLLRHQIKSLTYNQIVNIIPYTFWQKAIQCKGTIAQFRPIQYTFFRKQQLRWLTMYQSANIPRHYLTESQLKALPPACYDYPQDTFKHFFHRDAVPWIDPRSLSTSEIKYMSLYTISLLTRKQILSFPYSLLIQDKDFSKRLLCYHHGGAQTQKKIKFDKM
jgi:hypothetical protein